METFSPISASMKLPIYRRFLLSSFSFLWMISFGILSSLLTASLSSKVSSSFSSSLSSFSSFSSLLPSLFFESMPSCQLRLPRLLKLPSLRRGKGRVQKSWVFCCALLLSVFFLLFLFLLFILLSLPIHKSNRVEKTSSVFSFFLLGVEGASASGRECSDVDEDNILEELRRREVMLPKLYGHKEESSADLFLRSVPNDVSVRSGAAAFVSSLSSSSSSASSSESSTPSAAAASRHLQVDHFSNADSNHGLYYDTNETNLIYVFSRLFKSNLVLDGVRECQNFESFNHDNPSYFPSSSSSSSSSFHSSSSSSALSTFFDQPVCKGYAIYSDVRVCGDLYVRGRLTVVTGVNASSILSGESDHVKRRCELQSIRDVGDVNFPMADVWVVGNVEVGGNLYAGELKVDAGASVVVGIRGIRKSLASTIINTESDDYIAGGREQSSVPSSSFEGEEIGDKNNSKYNFRVRRSYGRIEQFNTFSSIPANEWINTAKSIFRGDEAILDLKCHVLGSMGTPEEFDSEESDDGLNEGENGFVWEKQKRLAKTVELARRRNGQKNSEIEDEKEERGKEQSIGDVVTLRIMAHNAASIIVYGNVIVNYGALLDSSAELHSICGQMYTNSSTGIGLVAIEGSVATFNGIGQNAIFQLYIEFASSVKFAGMVLVPYICRVDEASILIIDSSFLMSALFVNDMSQVLVAKNVEATDLVQAIDYGSMLIGGSLLTPVLQFFDGGNGRVMRSLNVTSYLTIEEDSQLIVSGTRVDVNNSVHVLSHSSFIIINADLYVRGAVKDVSSTIVLRKGSLYVSDNFLIGKNAKLKVAKDFIVYGNQMVNNNDTNTSTPCMYAETSDVIIGGNANLKNSWTKIGRGSTMTVNGPKGMFLENGFLLLDRGGEVRITQGGMNADLGITMQRNSIIVVSMGNITTEHIKMIGRCQVEIPNGILDVAGNAFMEGRSKVIAGNLAVVRGDLLYVDEESEIFAGAIAATRGDIFVEDGSYLEANRGDIVANTSIVCQDRGTVISRKRIISKMGVIVAENNSKIKAGGQVIADEIRRTAESVVISAGSSTGIQVFIQQFPDYLMPEFRNTSLSNSRSRSSVSVDPLAGFINGKKWKDPNPSSPLPSSTPPPSTVPPPISLSSNQQQQQQQQQHSSTFSPNNPPPTSETRGSTNLNSTQAVQQQFFGMDRDTETGDRLSASVENTESQPRERIGRRESRSSSSSDRGRGRGRGERKHSRFGFRQMM